MARTRNRVVTITLLEPPARRITPEVARRWMRRTDGKPPPRPPRLSFKAREARAMTARKRNGATPKDVDVEVRLRILDPLVLFHYHTVEEVREFVSEGAFGLLTAVVQRALVGELGPANEPTPPELVSFLDEARVAAWALADDLETLAKVAASPASNDAEILGEPCDPSVFDPAALDAHRRALLLVAMFSRDDFGDERTRALYELLAVRHLDPWTVERRAAQGPGSSEAPRRGGAMTARKASGKAKRLRAREDAPKARKCSGLPLRDVVIARSESGRSTCAVPPPRFERASEIPTYLRTLRDWTFIGLLIAGQRRKAAGVGYGEDFLTKLFDDLHECLDVLADTLETGTLEGVLVEPDCLDGRHGARRHSVDRLRADLRDLALEPRRGSRAGGRPCARPTPSSREPRGSVARTAGATISARRSRRCSPSTTSIRVCARSRPRCARSSRAWAPEAGPVDCSGVGLEWRYAPAERHRGLAPPAFRDERGRA